MKAMIGQRFNRLKVIERAGNTKWNAALWLCVCDCGKETIVVGSSLRNGHTQSCGCLMWERLHKGHLEKPHKKHGMYGTRFYRIWMNMKSRCNNPNHKSFETYGGAGIKVCEEWNDFQEFMRDMYDSYSKHAEKYGESNTTLERNDNKKGYNKENCIWATWKKQAANRGYRKTLTYEYRGEILTISELAKKYGINEVTLKWRVRTKGMTIQEAIEKKVK